MKIALSIIALSIILRTAILLFNDRWRQKNNSHIKGMIKGVGFGDLNFPGILRLMALTKYMFWGGVLLLIYSILSHF